MTVTRLGSTLAFGWLLSALTVLPVAAQQAPPSLPEEVQTFMERDQLRRWAQMIQVGDSLFNNFSCRRCHGENGTAGRNGPDLTDADWVQTDGSLAGIREVIFWGVRRADFSDTSRRFEMNPAGGIHLEWGEFDALAAYVWSLSNGTQLPQRGG
jgi:mono/diheme cytochrome c family protein